CKRDARVELAAAGRNSVCPNRANRARGSAEYAFGDWRPRLFFPIGPTAVFRLRLGQIDDGGICDRVGGISGSRTGQQLVAEPVRTAAGIDRLQEFFLRR